MSDQDTAALLLRRVDRGEDFGFVLADQCAKAMADLTLFVTLYAARRYQTIPPPEVAMGAVFEAMTIVFSNATVETKSLSEVPQ